MFFMTMENIWMYTMLKTIENGEKEKRGKVSIIRKQLTAWKYNSIKAYQLDNNTRPVRHGVSKGVVRRPQAAHHVGDHPWNDPSNISESPWIPHEIRAWITPF
jgi:hypothetical protein